MTPPPFTPSPKPGALGLDAGGTQTRWALADATGAVIAEGRTGAITGLQLAQPGGRLAMSEALQAAAAEARRHAPFDTACLGLTGFDGGTLELLRETAAPALGVAAAALQAMSDIELSCRSAFAPGAGYVVYAGTGSIAAFLDEDGALHRAGGRGSLIDDGGSGCWMAREAMRHVWRAEDEAPGAWRGSPLAAAVFAHIGGSSWDASRRWMYTAARGTVGELALAVAGAADADPAAAAILDAAGRELARLGNALRARFGARPIALAGRVFDLHPRIEAALRAALAGDTAALRRPLHAHHAAAHLALGRSSP